MSTFHNPYKVGDRVAFVSIHGPNPIDGSPAIIIEIREGHSMVELFPHGLTFCLQFDEDQRLTWCRIDQMKRI
jgi:hypothetical protein